MANKSKRKGKRFEEKIAKIIRNKWNLNKHECHRALSSGTYKTDYSDIIFVPETIVRPHIIIECKVRRNIPINSLMSFTFNNEFNNWVKQIEESSKKYFEEFKTNPLKLIVFGIDRLNPLVIFDFFDFISLIKNPNYYNLSLINKNYLSWKNVSIFNCLDRRYILTHFDYFIGDVIHPIKK